MLTEILSLGNSTVAQAGKGAVVHQPPVLAKPEGKPAAKTPNEIDDSEAAEAARLEKARRDARNPNIDAFEPITTRYKAAIAGTLVRESTVEGMIGELSEPGKGISTDQAKEIITKWLKEAAEKAASEPDSAVTFEVLSGKLKVDASKKIGGVKITGGEVDLYKLAILLLVTCGLTDLVLEALQSGDKDTQSKIEGCLKNLFGLASTANSTH